MYIHVLFNVMVIIFIWAKSNDIEFSLNPQYNEPQENVNKYKPDITSSQDKV